MKNGNSIAKDQNPGFDWSLFQAITKRARETVDPNAGLRVKRGLIQLVRVTYNGSKSTVTPLGPWVSLGAINV